MGKPGPKMGPRGWKERRQYAISQEVAARFHMWAAEQERSASSMVEDLMITELQRVGKTLGRFPGYVQKRESGDKSEGSNSEPLPPLKKEALSNHYLDRPAMSVHYAPLGVSQITHPLSHDIRLPSEACAPAESPSTEPQPDYLDEDWHP